MKLIHSVRIHPVSFKTFGPTCLSFKWNIGKDDIWVWMEDKYPGEAFDRLEICTDRMIMVQPMRAYFDNENDAMLFKLVFGGYEPV